MSEKLEKLRARENHSRLSVSLFLHDRLFAEQKNRFRRAEMSAKKKKRICGHAVRIP